VAALHAQLEALTTTVAQMRRDAPARAARAYADALNRAVEEEEEEDDDDEWALQKIEEDDAQGWDELLQRHPEWKLQMPFSTEQERERWREGEMAEVYADALRTLVRLQPELGGGAEEEEEGAGDGDESIGLAATVGKVERARKAAEVVEKM
jgi:kinetochor protein Mis14/NSL1